MMSRLKANWLQLAQQRMSLEQMALASLSCFPNDNPWPDGPVDHKQNTFLTEDSSAAHDQAGDNSNSDGYWWSW